MLDNFVRFYVPLIALIVTAASSKGQSTLIPLTTRRDMVFDRAGAKLYITTSDGFVQRYNLSAGQLESPYNLGGSLNGIDIAPDDSFLLAAQNNVGGSQGTIHKVNLGTGNVTNVNYTCSSSEAGAWDVSIASNGLAFVTTQYYGDGWVPLRQIDLATNAVTIRTDWPRWVALGIEQNTQIHRSADRTLLYFLESSSSDGPVFTYNPTTNIFGPEITTGYGWSGGTAAAVNRNGTLVATRRGDIVLDTAPNFGFVRAFNGLDSGAAFDPLSDTLYAVRSATGEIVAYDTGTFAEKFRLDIGETVGVLSHQFDTGTLVASPDGRYLALATASGVRIFTIPTTMPTPSPTPTPSLGIPRDMVFDHSGQHLYISTDDGFVFPYNLATATLGTPYDLGGSLRGIDIAPDDSFLLVAQHTVGMTEGSFYKLNPKTGAVTNLNYTRQSGDEGGGWDLAIGSNGLALVTTDGSIWPPLREINLATNAINVRNDPPSSDGYSNQIYPRTQVHRSVDGMHFYFLGWNIFTYNTVTNTFSPGVRTGTDSTSTSAAINRDGSLLATRIAGTALDTAPDFNFVHSLSQPDGGLAFDGVKDTLYAVRSSTSEIIAYDTKTFAERYRLPIGATVPAETTRFGSGGLVASPDGRYLALRTSSDIRLIPIPNPAPTPPPAPSLGKPRQMVFDYAGQHLYITTEEGFVFPYNISTRRLETPYDVGGSLRGVDISADDSFLIVAQQNIGIKQTMFQRVDLKTGIVTNIAYTRPDGDFLGTWDVAISPNGLALGTAAWGWAPLRQIELTTNAITIRSDTPGANVYCPFDIGRGANGTLACGGGDDFFTYDPPSNTFSPASSSSGFRNPAINRDGRLLGGISYPNYASLETLPGFRPVHTFPGLDSGVAFDAVANTFYGVDSQTDQIIGYDTNDFTEKFRFDIGEDVSAGSVDQGPGLLVASHDGRYLALITPTTVRVFGVPGVSLLSVVSAKEHGDAGTFNIDLPLNGRGIECRSGGASGDYTLIFTFGFDLTSVDGASITSGTGMIGSAMIDSNDSHRYIVNLTGVANRQNIKVTLSNLNDLRGNFTPTISQQMALLIGDTTSDGSVNSADVSQTKSQSGNSVNGSNFREDVNADGFINSADVSFVKSKSGTGLPVSSVSFPLPPPVSPVRHDHVVPVLSENTK